ncbi:hypothetical protein BEWA_041660 [Theileria equi strain WA]|uniref:Signal peptide-containing protein n=1 Tax=Theileria equi strain WA TaxID=1537102 RepID=L1LG44_THEEQ|nr:hypothetical protein BEWA_041660 [Theileria equi strain WA]EKX74128.1 hypothetical protein BEWA_041660 [Theileria equi strain WA]|eukprot:XP_004833580.1 hypothetical protein BEWA_041660 [Theileria equi strain WA]
MALINFLFIFSVICKLGAECTWITLDLSLKETNSEVLVQDAEHYGIPFKIYAPRNGFDANAVVEGEAQLWKASSSGLKCLDVSLYFGNDNVSLAILSIMKGEVYSKYFVKVDKVWIPVHPQQWVAKMIKFSPAIARHIAARETPVESADEEEEEDYDDEDIISSISGFIGSAFEKVDKVISSVFNIESEPEPVVTLKEPVAAPKISVQEPLVLPKPSLVERIVGTSPGVKYEEEHVIYKAPKEGYKPQNYVGLDISKPNFELFMVEYNVSEVIGTKITPLYGNALVSVRDGASEPLWASKEGQDYCVAVWIHRKGDFAPLARLIIQKPDRVVILGYVKENGAWKLVGDSPYRMLYHSMHIADYTSEDLEKIKTGDLSSFSTNGALACFAVALIAFFYL